MKKIVAMLLAVAISLSLAGNTVLAASNNGKSEKKENPKVKNEKVLEKEIGNKKETKDDNAKFKKVKTSTKEKIKEKLEKTTVSDEKFKDSNKHWAEDAIKTTKKLGWINGYPDGTFKPEESISSVELVELAMNVAEDLNAEEVEDEPVVKDEIAVDDEAEEEASEEEELDSEVPAWAIDSVEKAIKNKVINVNRFHSHVQATRAEAAVTLAKAIGLEPVESTEESLVDEGLILAEDLGYILALLNEGIITGTPEGKFNPNNSITRGEIAAMLANLAKDIVEDEEEENEKEVTTDYNDVIDDEIVEDKSEETTL